MTETFALFDDDSLEQGKTFPDAKGDVLRESLRSSSTRSQAFLSSGFDNPKCAILTILEYSH